MHFEYEHVYFVRTEIRIKYFTLFTKSEPSVLVIRVHMKTSIKVNLCSGHIVVLKRIQMNFIIYFIL